MSKKTLFLVVFLLSAILGWRLLLHVQKNAQNTPEESIANSRRSMQVVEKLQEAQASDGVDGSSWKAYTVGDFKFQMNIPSGIGDNLVIFEEKVKEEHSFYGSATESILWFSYPLDKAISRSDRDLSLGKIDRMEVWYIDVIPVSDWREGICDGKPLCRQGRVIARDDSYVFESGFRSVEGAGRLCLDYSDVQKSFCESYKGLIDFVESNRFKFSLGQRR